LELFLDKQFYFEYIFIINEKWEEVLGGFVQNLEDTGGDVKDFLGCQGVGGHFLNFLKNES
jgi:hypothetical protein